jgi:hypothetical protein
VMARILRLITIEPTEDDNRFYVIMQVDAEQRQYTVTTGRNALLFEPEGALANLMTHYPWAIREILGALSTFRQHGVVGDLPVDLSNPTRASDHS